MATGDEVRYDQDDPTPDDPAWFPPGGCGDSPRGDIFSEPDTALCFVCRFPADAAVVGLDVDPKLVIRAAPFCDEHEMEAVIMSEHWAGTANDVQVLFVGIEDLYGVLGEMRQVFEAEAWVLTTNEPR